MTTDVQTPPSSPHDDTPWVRDFRGLWGHDTKDKLGGERGPSGPRYERNGTVRRSWGDPVGWSGLNKVAPNAEVELELVACARSHAAPRHPWPARRS